MTSGRVDSDRRGPKSGGPGGGGGDRGGPGKDEPETWSEVGRSKQYSATQEDVGHCLKFEVVPVDARSGAEIGTPTVFTTARVIPAPTPPKRNLVPVAHHDGSEGGRFSVLTYNVLAGNVDQFAPQFTKKRFSRCRPLR